MSGWTSKLFEAVLPPGRKPYAYQMEVARLIHEGSNVVLRAPTGAGKTLAALIPYLAERREGRYSRLIYALPLRTLVRSIHGEAKAVAQKLAPELTVTMQTGEQPDDPFFALGDIVVCTYDQLLSGLLGAPYGLPGKLANINAACVVGALVVFDEFHLMAADRAFLTGAACLAQFGGLTRSLWMSATATEPLVAELGSALNARCLDLSARDWEAVPSVARVRRTVVWRNEQLTADEIESHGGKRVVVICNRVEWARRLYEEVAKTEAWPAKLLHSRFFRGDREQKEAWLRDHFGKDGSKPALLICTQVIEAGMDITSDVLLTHVAPMSSLVQRAGRCARFPPPHEDGSLTEGEVHVFDLPAEDHAALPYTAADLKRSRDVLRTEAAETTRMDPGQALEWVQWAHQEADSQALRGGWRKRGEETRLRISANVFSHRRTGVGDLIREVDDSVRVILDNLPPERPSLREPLAVSRRSLAKFLKERGDTGWAYVACEEDMVWEPLTLATLERCFFVALPLSEAKYTSDAGLVLGEQGETPSPVRTPPTRPGHGTLQVETWAAHTGAVIKEAVRRADREVPEGSFSAVALPGACGGIDFSAYVQAARFCALFHDFGKLQDPWQQWALAYERDRDPKTEPPAPLAHTQFHGRIPANRERQDRINESLGRRPTHAVQSAYFACWTAGEALGAVADEEVRALLASACCAAITSHHGGWVPDGDRFRCHRLWSGWKAVIPFLAKHGSSGSGIDEGLAEEGKRDLLLSLLEESTAPDRLRQHWPLVSLLMRVLRLSDQKATAEGSEETADG